MRRIYYCPVSDPNLGSTDSFTWLKWQHNHLFWYVIGHNKFSKHSFAVIDDFGTLVPVPAI